MLPDTSKFTKIKMNCQYIFKISKKTFFRLSKHASKIGRDQGICCFSWIITPFLVCFPRCSLF